MFGNYLTSALRALKRDRFHAALNISGLAVSLAAALLIALYIQHELSYDNFFTEPERVYRVEGAFQNNGQSGKTFGEVPFPTMEALRTDFGDQVIATHVDGGERIITVNGHHTRHNIVFAEENLFDVMDIPAAYGNPGAALRQPGTILLSRDMAVKLFGHENAVGEVLTVGREGKAMPDRDVTVGAVFRDIPENSYIKEVDIIASINSPLFVTSKWNRIAWTNFNNPTLIRLKDGVQAKAIEGQLGRLVDKYMPDNQKAYGKVTLSLRKLTDVHLQAGDDAVISDRNQIAFYALSGVAAFLILIACFNYVNLATARAILRTKEVGMRKILGGTQRQLVIQFMGEALITTVAAFLLAALIAALALPVFATLIDRDLHVAGLLTPAFLGFVLALLLFVSLVAGGYPAFVLASSQPAQLFQLRRSPTGRGDRLRMVMVGVQFTMTVWMAIAAVVVYAQVHYLRTFDLGFSKQGLLVIENVPTGDEAVRGAAFQNALAASAFIKGVAGSNHQPSAAYEFNDSLSRPDSQEHQEQAVLMVIVDENFFGVYGIKPMDGRVFSVDFGDEMLSVVDGRPVGVGSIVISESTVPYLGFSSAKEALGHVVLAPAGDGEYKIIGVVPDIHFRLGRAPIKPTVYYYRTRFGRVNLRVVTARVVPGGYDAALAHARQTWEQMFPERPMIYEFLEDRVEAASADDTRQSQLFAFFTGLAILVACLGLFGLASFAAARRTQEIAIRKVLGASTANVTRLLLWDFAKPVLLANIVAWPIAWVLMRQWLDGFAYRVELSPAFFIGASAVALGIALLTVMARTMRAARIRPAMALKYE